MSTPKRNDALTRTTTPGVYKRGGRYVVRYRVRGEERKRHARTYAEARALKASLTTDIARGEHRELHNTAFSIYATEWIESYAGRTAHGVRDSTRDAYRWCVQRATVYFGDQPLTEIEPRDVRAYVRWLQNSKKQKRDLSIASVQKHLGVLKLVFASAVEDGVIRASPATHTRVARPAGAAMPEAKRVRAMEREQLATVLRAVDPEWRLFFELLAATGLRIGEALELRWGDVDLGGKRLQVQRQVSKQGAVSQPKTRSGLRTVPLSTGICQRLWPLQGRSEALIFMSPRGQHVDQRWLRRHVLDEATEAAGVPWVTFHTFRHTCASLLFAEGKSPKQVQIWLGHTDPAFTLRTYVHLIDDDALGAPLDATAWATVGPHDLRETGQTGEVANTAEVGI